MSEMMKLRFFQTQETDNWGSGRQRWRPTWWPMSRILTASHVLSHTWIICQIFFHICHMWTLLMCCLTHGSFVKYFSTYVTCERFSCVVSHMDYLSNIFWHMSHVNASHELSNTWIICQKFFATDHMDQLSTSVYVPWHLSSIIFQLSWRLHTEKSFQSVWLSENSRSKFNIWI